MDKLATPSSRSPSCGRRSCITLLFLAIYRIGYSHPAADRRSARDEQGAGRAAASAQVLGFVSMFSGGNLSHATIFGLGIMPYISASIIFQLLGRVYPPLEKLQKEGESGRKKINEYTRYATVAHLPLPGAAWYVQLHHEPSRTDWAVGRVMAGYNTVLLLLTAMILTMTAGTVFLMWLGEQIDEYGIGNGISLIIMAGIVARIPAATASLFFEGGQFKWIGLHAGRRRRPGHQLREARRADLPVHRRRRRGHRHHQGPAAHPDAVGQARPRPARLRRHPAVPAAEGQPGRRHAGDLRVGSLLMLPIFLFSGPGQRRPTGAGRRRSATSFERQGYIYNVSVHRADLLLLLLLDGHHLQPEGHGQQPEGLRQLHPRLSAGQADGRLPRAGDDADHLRRGGVPGGRSRSSRRWSSVDAGREPRRSPASTAARAC